MRMNHTQYITRILIVEMKAKSFVSGVTTAEVIAGFCLNMSDLKFVSHLLNVLFIQHLTWWSSCLVSCISFNPASVPFIF